VDFNLWRTHDEMVTLIIPDSRKTIWKWEIFLIINEKAHKKLIQMNDS
jgi:hypothetical protein